MAWELAGSGPWLDALTAVREQAEKARPDLGAEEQVQMDSAVAIFDEVVPRHADPQGTAELAASGTRDHDPDTRAFSITGSYSAVLTPQADAPPTEPPPQAGYLPGGPPARSAAGAVADEEEPEDEPVSHAHKRRR